VPIGEFDDWEDCIETMTSEEGHDEETAEDICGALEQEAKSDHGDARALFDAIKQGSGLIADVGVDLVSGVDVPAVDSKWVMTKSGGARKGHDFRANSPVLLAKDADTDQRLSYAAAMVPREPDKEGDVVSTPTVERAAHDFIKQSGGVDTDHSLIDGEGEVVESWVLKQEREFDLPGGETESYGAGTWMVGIEWGTEAWERIKSGDLTGLSIYGMAEHVPLSRSVECSECGCGVSASKRESGEGGDTHKAADEESGGMAPDSTGTGDGDGDTTTETDGPTIGEVAASVDDLADTVESVKDAVETEKDEQEAAAELGEAHDLAPSDVLDIVEAAAMHDTGEVMAALDSIEASAGEETKENDGDGEDEEEDEETEKSADDRVDDANLSKGGSATGTAAKAHEVDESTGTGTPSYRAVATNERDH
jgi:hypothetical protein